jgi:hypothetical protein
MHGHTFPEGRHLFWKFPAGLFLKARRPFTQRFLRRDEFAKPAERSQAVRPGAAWQRARL